MHGAFYALTRVRTRLALRRAGYSRTAIDDLMAACEDDVIDAAAEQVGGVKEFGALGDGTIIQAIIDFLRSEQGQALIAALIKLLLLAIAV